MKCKKCGHDNAPVKKTCERCSAILEGYTLNNVTGEFGYRNADGSFTPTVYEEGKSEVDGAFKELLEMKSSMTGQTFEENFNNPFFKSMISEPLPIAVKTVNKEEYLAMHDVFYSTKGMVGYPSNYEEWVITTVAQGVPQAESPVIYFRMDGKGFGVTPPNFWNEEYRIMSYNEYIEVITPKPAEIRIGLKTGDSFLSFLDRLGNEMVGLDYEGNFKVYGRPTTDPERIVQAMSKYAVHHKKYFK